VSFVPN